MPTPALDLTPGTTYTLGDPSDPANTLTVRGRPHPHTVHSLHGPGVEVIRIPVTTFDGTHTHDTVFPGDTIQTNRPTH